MSECAWPRAAATFGTTGRRDGRTQQQRIRRRRSRAREGHDSRDSRHAEWGVICSGGRGVVSDSCVVDGILQTRMSGQRAGPRIRNQTTCEGHPTRRHNE